MLAFGLSLTALLSGWNDSANATEADPVEISWPAEEWIVSSPEAEGLAAEPVDRFIEELKAGKYGKVDHFLLIRHGRIVADQRIDHDYAALAKTYDPEDLISPNPSNPLYDYDNPDLHPYYQGTDLHTLQSVTKSVTSAALGIAVDEDVIDGVEVKAMPFFDQYAFDRSDPRKQEMTLEDLLTMRSGIEWETEGGYSQGTHSTVLLEGSDKWIQYVVDQPMDQNPGTVYEYNDGASVLIGKILRVATGKRADEWAREKLFNPIGIDDFFWKITPDGETDTEGGLFLSAHDLARLGYLFLREGVWNGKQVISKDWVQQSVNPIVQDTSPDNPESSFGYGYQWWVHEHEEGQPIVFGGRGFGGQSVTVFPESDVVAVFLGWDPRNDPGAASREFYDNVLPAALSGH